MHKGNKSELPAPETHFTSPLLRQRAEKPRVGDLVALHGQLGSRRARQEAGEGIAANPGS